MISLIVGFVDNQNCKFALFSVKVIFVNSWYKLVIILLLQLDQLIIINYQLPIECTTVASLLVLKLNADEDCTVLVLSNQMALFEINNPVDRQVNDENCSYSN